MEDHGGSERNGEKLKGRSFTWRVEDEKIPYRYHLQLSTLLVGRVPGASILSVPCWSCDRSEGRFGKPKFRFEDLGALGYDCVSPYDLCSSSGWV